MKIESVKLMRTIRDQMSKELKNMEWKDEQEYLRNHIKTFVFLVKEEPNKALNSDDNSTKSIVAEELCR